MKYAQEARFLLGFAGVRKIGEEREQGVRLDYFDYTQKKIIYIKEENDLIHKAINKVKSMDDREAIRKGWCSNPREQDNRIWKEDPISFIEKLGRTSEIKLNEIGITKVFQLANIQDETIVEKAHQSGITHNRLQSFIHKARQAIEGTCNLPIVDYRTAENPYLSRYGSANWEIQVRQTPFFSNSISIKQLIIHMDDATKRAFAGTQYEATYLWAHDALNQMMDKQCQEWMQEKDLLKHWVRPVLGVSDNIRIIDDATGEIRTSTRYKNRPPGDSPELMPCDNSLFRDLKCSLDLCCAITNHLPKTDPRRFSKATPKLLAAAVKKIYDPVNGIAPRPERILQDIDRIPNALKKIVEADGGIVIGLADRNGHRKNRCGRKRVYHPPKEDQVAKSFVELGIHPDVLSVAEELIENEKQKFQASRGGN